MSPERIRILIVDDDQTFVRDMKSLMKSEYDVDTASSGAAALQAVRSASFDAVLLDIDLGRGTDGFEVLAALRSREPDLPVIMVTGDASSASAVAALKMGACDYLDKRPDLRDLGRRIMRALDERRVLRENAILRDEVSALKGRMVGTSPAAERLDEEIRNAALGASAVLILGETGTGKEVVAREIHRLATPNRPFVALNCAAIPAELFESRLFGSERGAYTGAERTLPGAFEVAADGVLFLDEITEIEPALQAKLLRVLEEREFERIGSSRRIRFRGRVLASSNRDAREGVRSGSLRQDLYYRLSTYVIRVPPLRERREDIPALAAYFLERKSAELKRTKPDLTDEQVRALCALDWPGNVRELENAIESFIVSGRLAVSSAMLREETGEDDPDVYALPYGQAKEALLRRFQRKYIASVLSASGGDVHAAAARMGLTRFGLQKLMRHLGMAPSERAGS